MNIAAVLQQQAHKDANAAALIDVHRGTERVVTFSELNRKVASVAAKLAQCGFGLGDAVLILHPVSIELYVFLIALFRLGGVAVFLDPSAGLDHVQRCSVGYPLKGFFGSVKAQWLRLAVPGLRRISHAFCSSWFPGTLKLSSDSGPEHPEITGLEPDSPALVTFTSGSTGEPKAALRTHRFLLAQHRALERSLDLKPGTVDLTTLPIFVLANLASGVTSVMPHADLRAPGKINPVPVLAQIQRRNVATTAASPAFVERLIEECEQRGESMPQLHRVFMGGAPVFPNLLRRAAQVFPKARITAVYGSTEAEPMAEIELDEISPQDFNRMSSGGGLLAGHPDPSLTLRIIRDTWGQPISTLTCEQFERMRAATGEPGEIVVNGDHVLPGYMGGVGDQETKFRVDGARWHRTGDLGYFDDSSRLWLLGRCNAKIEDERGVLYPFAVECAAQQHHDVVRAALCQRDHRRILAVQAKRPSVTKELSERLKWAELDEIILVARIPLDRRHNAKVDYPTLDRMLK